MTATDRGRRSDALYYDNVGMQRRRLCDMVANLESDNAELREQMDGLASSLRNDWQIEASWDGLRRVWYVGWTDEHVESCAECAKELGAYADSLCDPLKAENAKLRELVRQQLIALKVCNSFACMPTDTRLARYIEQANKLGIEVDG